MTQIINCSYSVSSWWLFNNIYTCKVENITILENSELKFVGDHQNGKYKEEIRGIIFQNCSITKIPQGLTKSFPFLRFLRIFDSKLKQVERDDLKEYSKIIFLSFYSNEIEYLPGDLLTDMVNLEVILFYDNQLEIIEPNLLNGLDKLRYVDFRNNDCIKSFVYKSGSNESNATVEDIKSEIRSKFSNLSPALTEKYGNIKKCEKIKRNNKILSKPPEIPDESSILTDLKKIIRNEKLKDFTVKVNDEEFKVHKLLLAARSSVFTELIENNIDAESLDLTDEISPEIFHQILKFIYTDELPQANILELLILANKYGIESLQRKSFEEIKKILGVATLDEELIHQPEKLAKLIEITKKKEELEEMMKLLDAEFHKMLP